MPHLHKRWEGSRSLFGRQEHFKHDGTVNCQKQEQKIPNAGASPGRYGAPGPSPLTAIAPVNEEFRFSFGRSHFSEAPETCSTLHQRPAIVVSCLPDMPQVFRERLPLR